MRFSRIRIMASASSGTPADWIECYFQAMKYIQFSTKFFQAASGRFASLFWIGHLFNISESKSTSGIKAIKWKRPLSAVSPPGRVASVSTRLSTPRVSGFPHTGQLPMSDRVCAGVKHTPHFRWPSAWYFPLLGIKFEGSGKMIFISAPWPSE
jgi:hypothetical protein